MLQSNLRRSSLLSVLIILSFFLFSSCSLIKKWFPREGESLPKNDTNISLTEKKPVSEIELIESENALETDTALKSTALRAEKISSLLEGEFLTGQWKASSGSTLTLKQDSSDPRGPGYYLELSDWGSGSWEVSSAEFEHETKNEYDVVLTLTRESKTRTIGVNFRETDLPLSRSWQMDDRTLKMTKQE